MKKISSWEFSLKSSGHDVLKKLYFLRDIPGRQKKTVLFFKEILLFDGLLFFKRPSLEDSRNCTIYIYIHISSYTSTYLFNMYMNVHDMYP